MKVLRVLQTQPVQCEKVVGVVTVALFVFILTYVYGEAEQGGQHALISLHRLKKEIIRTCESPIRGHGGEEVALAMIREEELEKEIEALKARLKDREDALPAHSVRPEQILVIEELETAIKEKKKELDALRKERI